MKTIMLKNDSKAYQFSFDKFEKIYNNWKPEEHDNLSFSQFLYENLLITSDCLYNYRHRRNGMDEDNIKRLEELLSISMEDLLEEKVKENETVMNKKENNKEYSNVSISEFSKAKLFEIISAIDECIFAFFAVFNADDEYYEVLEAVRKNAIAIPVNDGVKM